MKPELEDFYYGVDKKLEKIKGKLKRQKIETNPVIFNFDEVPFWYHKKPQSTFCFKGTKRVPISNTGGGKNEKSRFTVILGDDDFDDDDFG